MPDTYTEATDHWPVESSLFRYIRDQALARLSSNDFAGGLFFINLSVSQQLLFSPFPLFLFRESLVRLCSSPDFSTTLCVSSICICSKFLNFCCNYIFRYFSLYWPRVMWLIEILNLFTTKRSFIESLTVTLFCSLFHCHLMILDLLCQAAYGILIVNIEIYLLPHQ